MSVEIIQGDCRERLGAMREQSVHCCITSPPYWGLRDYGLPATLWGGQPDCEHEWGEEIPLETDHKPTGKQATMRGTIDRNSPPNSGQWCRKCGAWRGCLGLEPTLELYIEHMVAIFREVWRVLRDDGTLWLNLGDSYAGGGRAGKGGIQHWGGIESQNQDRKYGPPTAIPKGLKPKDLCEIPSAVAKALRDDGWTLRSRCPWLKRNSMPSSVTDRPSCAVEYVFLLSKTSERTYWVHRDGAGTRNAPDPDYRWTHVGTGEETAVEPANWKAAWIPCPNCEGTGRVRETKETSMFGVVEGGWGKCRKCKALKDQDERVPEGDEEEDEDEGATAQPRDYWVREWTRANLWTGHAYYYDAEAVRVGLADITRREAEYKYEGQDTKDYARAGAQSASGTKKRIRQAIADGRITGRSRRNSDWFFESWQGLYTDEEGEPLAFIVNPKGFKGAHFATFPPKLVEPCVLAGTSPQACPVCGAPWERVTTKDTKGAEEWKKACGADKDGHYHGEATKDYSPARAQDPSETKARILAGMGRVTTVTWQPTCECEGNDGGGRCVVLDPFGGSGTVGVVAQRFGRDAVLIEMSEEYCEMARARLAVPQTQELFT